MVIVWNDNRRLIRAGRIHTADEVTLLCHSTDDEIKETGIQNQFERRFEEGLNRIHTALDNKHGTKRYEKVIEKIGRLKERYRLSSHFQFCMQFGENCCIQRLTWYRSFDIVTSGIELSTYKENAYGRCD
ncbi:MAG: hypothetical protein NTX75_01070 [Proteobacteria bacterium]|nr:hypothetical protein [Pseudomonadota bacterium]